MSTLTPLQEAENLAKKADDLKAHLKRMDDDCEHEQRKIKDRFTGKKKPILEERNAAINALADLLGQTGTGITKKDKERLSKSIQ